MNSFSPLMYDLMAYDLATAAARSAAVADVAAKINGKFRFVEMKTFACGGQQHEIGAFQHLKTGMMFHLIPGGEFTMGSSGRETAICKMNGWKGDLGEHPALPGISVGPMLVGRFLVTEGEWNGHGGNELHWKLGPGHPADGVARNEARRWCAALGLRLPNEAEWEYACRAGTQSVFFWGDKPNTDYAWMKENHPTQDDYRNHEEKEHADKANAFGLIDLLGSLSEWVQDDAYSYEDSSPDGRYAMFSDDDRSDGILRGGCFMYGWGLCRSATRIRCSDYGDTGIGFRAWCGLEEAMNEVATSAAAAESPEQPGMTGSDKKPW